MLSSKKDINQQLHDTIYKKVTKKTHNHESPKKNGDGTITKCIEFFKEGADSNVLSTLEKSLSERIESQKSPKEKEKCRKHYKYYIENFLPALKTGVIKSKELSVPAVFNSEIEQSQGSPTRRGKILEIISGITNKGSNKDHSGSTIQNQKGRRNNQIDRRDNAMGLFKNKSFSSEVAVAESLGSSALERDSLAKGVSGKGTPGKYNILRNSGYSTVPISEQLQASEEKVSIAQSQLNGSFSQSDLSIDYEDLKNEKPNTTADTVEVPSGANTSKLSSGNDSDSGINSPDLASSSRRSSISSTLSSTEEDSNPQKEETGNKVLLEQTAEEEPAQVSSQCLTLGSRKKENMDPDGQAAQMASNQGKDPMRPEEKEEEAVSSKQEASKDILSKKQSNNRNFHVVLVAGCALSTIGCIVAGVMTSGLVGAGLLAMAAVFAIAAVAELHSNFLSSKLTSISVEPHVNDKELTACSHL